MVVKRALLGAGTFIGMLILILDGKTAIQGTYEGITICLKTVIPSLFPFFVLSNLITSIYMGMPIPALHAVGNLCGIPSGMESILVPSFLGGYPVGAQIIGQAWRQGQIPKKEAERLLSFCNNPGPSFLFGMVSVLFPNTDAVWVLWAIQIITALAVAKIFSAENVYTGKVMRKPISLPESLKNAMKAMMSVCGWIIVFRIVIAFLNRWILWIFPVPVQAAAVGILELSNGCMALFNVEDLHLRFIICAGILTFGGICVIMQVISAADGLSPKNFFAGKCIQTLLSVLLAVGIAYGKPMPIIVVALVFLRKTRKNGSIPVNAGV